MRSQRDRLCIEYQQLGLCYRSKCPLDMDTPWDTQCLLDNSSRLDIQSPYLLQYSHTLDMVYLPYTSDTLPDFVHFLLFDMSLVDRGLGTPSR